MGNLDWNLFDCILLWCVPKRRYSIEDAGKLILLSNYFGLKCMNGGHMIVKISSASCSQGLTLT